MSEAGNSNLLDNFRAINQNFDCEPVIDDLKRLKEYYYKRSVVFKNCVKKISEWGKFDIQEWSRHFRTMTIDDPKKYQDEILSVIWRAVQLVYNFELRDVQLISILALIGKRSDASQGRLLQIATGEGKSITIAALAAIKVFLGDKVDVITSSEVLAKRDSREHSDFYKLLGITVANNIDEKDYGKPKECYKKDIVYGNTHSFQSDILKDEFKMYGTLNNRKQKALLIDEVDSMFLDEYDSSTYLSDSKPGFEKLKFVLFLIWQSLEQNLENQTTQLNDKIKDIIEIYMDDVRIDGNDGYPILYLPIYIKEFIRKNIDNWIRFALMAKIELKKDQDYIVDKGEIKIVDYQNTGVIRNQTQYGNGLHQFLQIKHNLEITDYHLITNYLSNIGFFKRYINDTCNNICGVTGTLGSENCKSMLSRVYKVDFVNIPTFAPNRLDDLNGRLEENEVKWLEAIKNSVTQKLDQNRAVLVLAESIDAVKRIKGYLETIPKIKLLVYERNDEKELKIEALEPREAILSTNLAGRGIDIKLNETVIENNGLHVCLTFLSVNSRVQLQAYGRAARQGQKGSAEIILNYESEIKICQLESQVAKEILLAREMIQFDDQLLNSISSETLDFLCQVPATLEDFKLLRDKEEKMRLNASELRIQQIQVNDSLFEELCKFLAEIREWKNLEDFQKRFIRNAIEERWAIWLDLLGKNLSKNEALNRFNSLKSSIISEKINGEIIYSITENAYYIDQICMQAINSLQSEWIKFLRQPFSMVWNKKIGFFSEPFSMAWNKTKGLFSGKKIESKNLKIDEIISLCDKSLQLNPSSFVSPMNKAVCLILLENQKGSDWDYEKAREKLEESNKLLQQEICFWKLFEDMLKERKKKIQIC